MASELHKALAKHGGNLDNFGGKRAAPFASRKSSATDRKRSSTKTAAGTKKKVGY